MFFLRVATVLAVVASASADKKWADTRDLSYTFDDYLSEFGKAYAEPKEHAMRKGLFEKTLKRIMRVNQAPLRTWKEGVNHMSDWTPQEFKKLLGGGAAYHGASDVQTFHSDVPLSSLPDSVDWTTHQPPVLTPVKDQAACGSCWSFATAETLESQWAIKKGELNVLSEQQILSCPMGSNPKNCGGTGGCSGGVAELAYKSIQTAGGLVKESDLPYISGHGRDAACPSNISSIPKAAQVTGVVKLPVNEYAPLMQAIATIGPLAITVDASAWSSYTSGVYDGCDKDGIYDLDHAVQLVGYGTDNGTPYWKVRNSWGTRWGEEGFIRLKRNVVPEGGSPSCGTDKRPSDGTGCDGGNRTQHVCGTCGILFDVCYPTVE